MDWLVLHSHRHGIITLIHATYLMPAIPEDWLRLSIIGSNIPFRELNFQLGTTYLLVIWKLTTALMQLRVFSCKLLGITKESDSLSPNIGKLRESLFSSRKIMTAVCNRLSSPDQE